MKRTTQRLLVLLTSTSAALTLIGHPLVMAATSSSSTVDTTPIRVMPNSGDAVYTVQTGDALWKISASTGCSIQNLISENNISNPNMIYPGEKFSIPTAQEIIANEVLATAQKYLGDAYLYGGNTPAGFDCSGFTQFIFADYGISLPHHGASQYLLGTPVASTQLIKGDLVFFSGTDTGVTGISHVGIYLGNNEFISAASQGVIISSLSNVYWAAHYTGARRIIQ